MWESLRVCSILLQPILPTCKSSFFSQIVDSRRVVDILCPTQDTKQTIPLEAVSSDFVHVKDMHCFSDRLFTKLSKTDEAAFLKL